MNLDSFLCALREDPDDMGQRLVFADWLEDQGDADWAELIRLQCAALPRAPWDDRALAGSPRERELCAALARLDSFRWRTANFPDEDLPALLPALTRCRSLALRNPYDYPPGDRYFRAEGLAALLEAMPPGRPRDFEMTSELGTWSSVGS